ncbi:MAG: hypothetical protein ACJ749_11135 [Flavisolibacter sp.]
MSNSSIIKELNQIITMNEMVMKTAARLKKKIEGGVSTPPKKKVAAIDQKHVKAMLNKRENFIKKQMAC